MVLANERTGVTLAEKSHPEAGVETGLPNSLAASMVSSRRDLDEETKNND